MSLIDKIEQGRVIAWHCGWCEHEWNAVLAKGAVTLECPKCHQVWDFSGIIAEETHAAQVQ